MTARERVTAARRRFRCAVNAQFDATGSVVYRHVALRIASRTGVHVAAVWPGANEVITGPRKVTALRAVQA